MGKSSDELLRSRRKMVAYERTKLRLRQQLERIDFELDVLKPKIEELDAAAARGELPEFGVDVS